MKNKHPKMNKQDEYKCELCGKVDFGVKFPRKSQSGNYPPLCALCCQRRSKEVKNILALDGKFGIKRQTAARMLKEPTKGELAMMNILRNARIKFKPQVVMLGFIPDFHLCGKCIIVEVDGDYHQAGDQPDYDKGRDAIFRDHGFITVRVSNEEAINDPEMCLQRIIGTLSMPRLVRVKRNLSNRQKVIDRGKIK
jgi:very-short-patch-repair endonuclease